MKKIYSFIVAMVIAATLMGQVPESFKYQAVLRNLRGDIKANASTTIGIVILQGSVTGTSIYSETHNVTTDNFGLINLEIGKGTPTLGTLSTVDWSTGTYYIKIVVDGVEMGTSQLLTVPYALYAKRAANYSETDPVFVSHPANGIIAANITNWNTAYGWGNHTGLYRLISWIPSWTDVTDKPTFATIATSGTYNDLTNKPNIVDSINTFGFNGQYTSLTGAPTLATIATSGSYSDLTAKPITDGSETKLNSGTNITITGTGTESNPYIINTPNSHYIGEFYGGGIIFYIDHSGEHGLIASLRDIGGTSVQWSNIAFTSSDSKSSWDGNSNSNTIITQIGHTSSAAKLCIDYSNESFDDWFLPSIDQLTFLYNQAYVINQVLENDGNPLTIGMSVNYYWSSTEFNSIYVYTDLKRYQNKDDPDIRVRAVRAF